MTPAIGKTAEFINASRRLMQLGDDASGCGQHPVCYGSFSLCQEGHAELRSSWLQLIEHRCGRPRRLPLHLPLTSKEIFCAIIDQPHLSCKHILYMKRVWQPSLKWKKNVPGLLVCARLQCRLETLYSGMALWMKLSQLSYWCNWQLVSGLEAVMALTTRQGDSRIFKQDVPAPYAACSCSSNQVCRV